MPRARYITELLQTHAEELAFVHGQRCAALCSDEQTLRDYADLGERLEAHVQGLLCAPAEDLLQRLAPALQADADADGDDTFAAAYALLRTGHADAGQAVMSAFLQASGAQLAGLRDALALATATPHATPHADALRNALQQAAPATAAAAAAVLASHRLLAPASVRLGLLLQDEDAPTAALAWRAAMLADRQSTVDAGSRPTRPYWLALSHKDPAVRDAGWAAVAWAGQAAALPTLRNFAGEGDTVALRWLAALGAADDVALVQRGVLALASGSDRCMLLARHGHPGGLNALLRWMREDDESTAVAAGEAFEQVTGIDVRGERRQLSVPADADDFDREMAPLAWFPDADKAHAVLQQRQGEWAGGTRWRRGLCVTQDLEAAALGTLDMQARWDIAARTALAGGAAAPPPLV